MTGKEFKNRCLEIFCGIDGKKIMNSIDGGFKGITPILGELSQADKNNVEINAGDLSQKFDISTARVATILNTLEEKEFVIRNKSNDDKRITIVKLTDKGRDEVKRLDDLFDALFDKSIDGINDVDLETYFRVLSKIADNIKKI